MICLTLIMWCSLLLLKFIRLCCLVGWLMMEYRHVPIWKLSWLLHWLWSPLLNTANVCYHTYGSLQGIYNPPCSKTCCFLPIIGLLLLLFAPSFCCSIHRCWLIVCTYLLIVYIHVHCWCFSSTFSGMVYCICSGDIKCYPVPVTLTKENSLCFSSQMLNLKSIKIC